MAFGDLDLQQFTSNAEQLEFTSFLGSICNGSVQYPVAAIDGRYAFCTNSHVIDQDFKLWAIDLFHMETK